MILDFDLDQVAITEFGVGLDEAEDPRVVLVSVDGDVQRVLRIMVAATWEAPEARNVNPPIFSASEKYASVEYLVVPLDHDFATFFREIHEANNPPLFGAALSEPEKILCYFARLRDSRGRRLTAVKRASQFKGILKRPVVRFLTDALRLVEGPIFRLDRDFDLLIDSANVHVLRPTAFEYLGHLQNEILQAVPTNIASLRKEMPFVDFGSISEYAGRHPTAARFLASIRSLTVLGKVDRNALKKLCKENGVEVVESKGRLVVEDDQVMGFLEVLDRRRYEIELVPGSRERFRAASRSKIS